MRRGGSWRAGARGVFGCAHMIERTVNPSVSCRTRSWCSRSVLPAIAVIVAGSLLASCSLSPRTKTSTKSGTKEYFSEKVYGVSASPRVVASNKHIPKGGGRYQVGKPYKIRGKVYRPREDSDYSAVGLASWYGRAFHGRKTANGEIYDMGELTAAHPTLPLPSYARVTNLTNQRSVVVRINDRGPFAKGRIIDVSATAARVLGFKRAGVAKVKVDYVGKARMDGRDRKMLVASYKGPGEFGGGTLVASTATPKPKNVVLASLTPRRQQQRERPVQVDSSIDLFGAQRLDAPAITTPAFMPTGSMHDDPLAPLIMRTGFTMSYAASNRFSRAHLAAAALAQGGRTSSTIQIGTFGDRANAARIAPRFGEFGEVETHKTISAGRTLYIVRVIANTANPGASEAVIAAARAAGLVDAFVVSN